MCLVHFASHPGPPQLLRFMVRLPLSSHCFVFYFMLSLLFYFLFLSLVHLSDYSSDPRQDADEPIQHLGRWCSSSGGASSQCMFFFLFIFTFSFLFFSFLFFSFLVFSFLVLSCLFLSFLSFFHLLTFSFFFCSFSTDLFGHHQRYQLVESIII